MYTKLFFRVRCIFDYLTIPSISLGVAVNPRRLQKRYFFDYFPSCQRLFYRLSYEHWKETTPMFIVYVYHNGWLAVDKFDDIAAANAFADQIGGRVFDYHA